ncbi:hypothetical protein SMU74_05253, partial [Streptococcus mutans M2A]
MAPDTVPTPGRIIDPIAPPVAAPETHLHLCQV